MRLDEFLQRHAAHWARRQVRPMAVIIGLPEQERPALAFLWKTVCAHTGLQAVFADVRLGDERDEAMRWMREHAESCVFSLAHLIDEADPFAEMPPLGSPWEAVAGGSWLVVGLSSLLIETAFNRIAKSGSFHKDAQEELEWMAAGFFLERRYALSESGRLAAQEPDGAERLLEAAAAFRIPAELAWGQAYLQEARRALEGRAERSDAKAVLAAIREVPELRKVTLWQLFEPHVDRYAQTFKIGRFKKLAIWTALKLI